LKVNYKSTFLLRQSKMLLVAKDLINLCRHCHLHH